MKSSIIYTMWYVYRMALFFFSLMFPVIGNCVFRVQETTWVTWYPLGYTYCICVCLPRFLFPCPLILRGFDMQKVVFPSREKKTPQLIEKLIWCCTQQIIANIQKCREIRLSPVIQATWEARAVGLFEVERPLKGDRRPSDSHYGLQLLELPPASWSF
jgi:hypothetical protein